MSCCEINELWSDVELVLHSVRAYSVVDSSRVSTFIVSILLVVYGSFRQVAQHLMMTDAQLMIDIDCSRFCHLVSYVDKWYNRCVNVQCLGEIRALVNVNVLSSSHWVNVAFCLCQMYTLQQWNCCMLHTSVWCDSDVQCAAKKVSPHLIAEWSFTYQSCDRSLCLVIPGHPQCLLTHGGSVNNKCFTKNTKKLSMNK